MDLQHLRDALLTVVETHTAIHPGERSFLRRLRADPTLLTLRMKRVARIAKLVGAEGRDVLDAGAGMGLTAAMLSLLGARRVVAVEFGASRYLAATELMKELGISDLVQVIPGDVLQVDVPPLSLDAVISTEFLEHIADSAAYHRRAYSWLRPGGRIYGRTGANGANPLVALHFFRKWRWQDRTVYGPARAKMLSAAFPELSSSSLAFLVQRTRGTASEEMLEAARLWLAEGRKPTPRTVPRNPSSGAYFERLRYPKELLGELRAAGFDAELVRPAYHNITTDRGIAFRLLRALGPALEAGHPVSVVAAPWLEVLGRKNYR